MMQEFDYEELVKATENFSSSRLIGKGSHGWIYKGTLKDNQLVAVKKSSRGLVQNSKLDNEKAVLSSLKECPNVIKLLGTSHQLLQDSPKDKLLVMDFMPNGSLHDLLHADTTLPSWPKRIEIAIQLARAVKFLHEEKPLVIHRDIKSENVLFDQDWNAKLADFGLAIMNPNGDDAKLINSSTSTPPAGTMGYIDPSYTSPSKLSTKVDIFSYGVVLLEILSGRKAIDVSKSPASIVEWAVPLIEEQRFTEVCDTRKGMLLPSYMEGTLKHVLHIAARCVSSKEECRPLMKDIVSDMESLSCSIKRVRIFPIWTSLLKSMILLPKRQKLANDVKHSSTIITTSKCIADDTECEVSRGNGRLLLLKEVLADACK